MVEEELETALAICIRRRRLSVILNKVAVDMAHRRIIVVINRRTVSRGRCRSNQIADKVTGKISDCRRYIVINSTAQRLLSVSIVVDKVAGEISHPRIKEL